MTETQYLPRTSIPNARKVAPDSSTFYAYWCGALSVCLEQALKPSNSIATIDQLAATLAEFRADADIRPGRA